MAPVSTKIPMVVANVIRFDEVATHMGSTVLRITVAREV